ncbi:MAG: peptidoglycan DD-metalloendopeptidase family protein [Acaryochloris sp. RU_4_1]|nr:peptidoglycan DD-metalloendopeptidase family protein [Acaryochloris sp. RU_4_1]NJR56496.1 peptidoglycan DD-metalloendopeptidase family protein [Acaryochloris sp. CRU_2_0]
MIPLLAQLSVAPSIGDGNTAPAIGEAPPPAEPESQSEPVAVRLDSQPIESVEPPSDSINLPVPDPPLEPPAEDPSTDLAPPLEQPALEDSSPPAKEEPLPKEKPYTPESPPPSQSQPQAQESEGVAYQQPNTTIPFSVETIGYPLTSRFAVTSPFGWRQHPVNGNSSFHAGVDLAAPPGTPTLAMLSGRVVHADWEGGYGNSVVIEHPGTGLKTRYAHLSRIHVQVGQWIDKGGHIGDSGATGLVTGPHAHIEIMVNGQNVDPQPYLAQSSRQAFLWKRFHVWAG